MLGRTGSLQENVTLQPESKFHKIESQIYLLQLNTNGYERLNKLSGSLIQVLIAGNSILFYTALIKRFPMNQLHLQRGCSLIPERDR